MPFSPARRFRSLTAENSKVVLVIQSNVAGRLFVWLARADERIIVQAKKTIVWYGTEQLLPFIEATLRRSKAKLTDISCLLVVRGPGPFSAVRTGLIVANTLATILKIPIRGIVSAKPLSLKEIKNMLQQRQALKKTAVIRPWYGREPNITRPRHSGR